MPKKKATLTPVASYEGEIKIGNIVLPCAVLDDGRRILSQQGLLQAIGRARSAKGGQGATNGIMAFAAAKNLQPYISPELRSLSDFILYAPMPGGKAYGLGAEILPAVCELYIDAEKASVLTSTQMRIANNCNIIHRALARTSIIALVDEATGYQYVRERDALINILNKFIAAEYRKWTKTFPIEYYQEYFRLRGWKISTATTKRPAVVGKDTNDLIYERIAPGVLDELRRLNPKQPTGQRKQKHHQWLTNDFGAPRLQEHIQQVVILMKASRTMGEFKMLINRALPKFGKFQHPQLPFPD